MRPSPSPAPVLGKSRRASVWRQGMQLFLVATALGFFFAAQIHFSAVSMNRDVSWAQSLYWSFGDWYEWALLAPLVFWLCRRFTFERGTWPRSLSVHLGAGLVLAIIHAVMCAAAAVFQGWVTSKPITYVEALRSLIANRTHYNLVVYAVVVCGWHAWDYYRRLREREGQAVELAARLAQAQLQALRMQLNPHFLFNSLNAVSSLMLKDVAAANKMLSRLGELLRWTLEKSDAQEVTLQHELEFLRRYLEIEQLRFGERLQWKLEVESATLEAAVPNLILQPLVENAIRHAIEPQETAGKIVLRSSRQNGCLLLEVSDNGPGLARATPDEKPESEERRERIGLSNTRNRLHKLYGEKQQFALTGNALGGVTASLSIPFRVATLPGTTA